MFSRIDKALARPSRTAFLELAVAMLGASVAVAAVISHCIAKPIERLRRNTRALAKGSYETRMPVTGFGEFAQLATAFNELAGTLEAEREARRECIADISHELRTPLAVLKGEVAALEDGIREVSQERLASLRQEIDRLSQLVEDLHAQSLADFAGFRYRKSRVDLGGIVRGVLNSHRASLGGAGIATRCDINGANVVFADPTRLTQLVDNLLQNTCRYTDPPGILRVSLRSECDKVICCWEDSPPGVRDEDLPRLTDRRFRVESPRNRNTAGAGLGLAVAKLIVDAHGGSMEAAHSDLGGVRWQIVLPGAADSGQV